MSQDIQIRSIPDELAGLRLDQALARMFPEYSRSRLKEWLLSGAITVDGAARRPRDAVGGGERIEMQVQAETLVRDKPEPIALDIVFEDEQLLVINKPAGLVVHPGAGNADGTLVSPGLAGVQVYLQGALWEAAASQGVEIGLTNGLAIQLGF